VPFNKDVADANSGTFYSAMSNIDFKIGKGNPAATAIRFHAAQHAFLSHMEFDIGSGLAGLYQVGNEAEDLHFKGGRYGILAEKTSPAWGFVLLDSTFEGQRDAAIREHEAGLTLVNVTMRDTPVGIEIDRGYGDWLWGKDVRFENVSKAGVVISNENNVYTQVGFENAVAANTPVFARFRDSGKTEPGRGRAYRVSSFTHGLTLPGLGQMGEYKTEMKAEAVAAPAGPARPGDPGPAAHVRLGQRPHLGAKGDNAADDTAAIQKAIDTHRVVYFPAGFYRVTDTLKLRPDTVLIGLHPSLTQIVLPDRTPGYQGVGAPKALVESAPRATPSSRGWASTPAGSIPAPRPCCGRRAPTRWSTTSSSRAATAPTSPTGRGSIPTTPTPRPTRSGQALGGPVSQPVGDQRRRRDVRQPLEPQHLRLFGHLRVRHRHARPRLPGLGRAPCAHRDQPQPGRQLGVPGAADRGGGRRGRGHRLAGDPRLPRHPAGQLSRLSRHPDAQAGGGGGQGLQFARHPLPQRGGERRERRRHLRRERLRDLPAPDQVSLRERDPGRHQRAGGARAPVRGAGPDRPIRRRSRPRPSPRGPGWRSWRTASIRWAAAPWTRPGRSISPIRRHQRIYSWSDARKLSIVRDNTLDPVNLAVDASGNLLVLSSDGRDGTVYSFKPGSPDTEVTVIAATPAADHPGAATVLPVNWWNNGEFKDQLNPRPTSSPPWPRCSPATWRCPSPRNTSRPTAAWPAGLPRLPAGAADYRGLRFSDALDTYGFTTAKPGQRVFVANSSENKTYSGLVGSRGAITDLKPSPIAAARASRRTGKGASTSPTARCSSTRRTAGAGAGGRSGTAAAAGLRRPGQADPVRPDPPRAVRGARPLEARDPGAGGRTASAPGWDGRTTMVVMVRAVFV
jgi:hypothetical protein